MRDRGLDKYQVAYRLGVKDTTVADRRWRQRVGLLGVKIGGVIRYMESDVMRLIEQGRKKDRERR